MRCGSGSGCVARAPDARTFSQRLRRLREWASKHLDKPIVREKVLSLCDKRVAFVKAYAHPGCHRTSNPVDRLLRRLDYHLYMHAASARHCGGGGTAVARLGVDPRTPPPCALGRFERLPS